MALDLFCASLTTLCELILPMIVRIITNKAISDLASLTVSLVFLLCGSYIVLRIIDTAAQFFMESIGHIMGSKIEAEMRRDLFSHLQKLSFGFYDNTKVGQIMSRITTDLFDVTEFAHHCPEEFFIAGIKITASFLICCYMNVPLTLIVFSVLPLMFFCTRHFKQTMRTAFQDSRVQVGEINASVEDSLLGIRVVKSFANEQVEKDKFNEGNLRLLEIAKKKYTSMAGFHCTTRLFDGVMYILVVLIGSIFMIHGKITAPDLIAYLLYVTTLLNSVRKIVDFSEQFQRGMTGIERFCEIMEVEPDIADAPDAKPLINVFGKVRFDHVTFRYGEEEQNVLDDITFTVEPGENIALVGPSGGGKTTLCSLIPRFYEVTKGKITIDNQDISMVTLSSLRSQIGVVQQDVYLFSGTVLDNISYGKPGATREEIIEAAKLAAAHEFIMKFPDGYDTYVGERGLKLSGGQKQRISIARVFLKNPPILILDEATSALDNESEWIVQKSLEQLAKGRTTFTIAHRLSTIRNADHVLVLTEDGIVEQGTHEKLYQQKGLYHKLYRISKFGEEEE
ncbi:MAG: ABC transporter ATP-binding protein [Ruminococcaceae bacterium]|nr:ABC transporter ATP-binding protein [Oscillospiraceae bacterium]